MARGWESKHVEEQQAESMRGRDRRGSAPLTDQQQAIRQRRETLRLAEARTRAALEAAREGRHRDMLRLQLEALGQQIAALDSLPSGRGRPSS